MATMRGSRLPVGSSPWVAEERSAAIQIAHTEVDEFSFSARNDFEWLNEHMAGIFDENEINVAEIFKTPGKLRGKTPRTARKVDAGEARVPLGDIFSGTPKGAPNPFLQQLNRLQSPNVKPADSPKANTPTPSHSPKRRPVASPRPPIKPTIPHADSGYHGGSQSQEMNEGVSSPNGGRTPVQPGTPMRNHVALHAIPAASPRQSPTRARLMQSPTATFMTAKEEQTTKVIPNATQTLVSPEASRTPAAARQQRPASPARQPQSPSPSPKKSSPVKSSPMKTSPIKDQMRSPITRKPVPSPAISKQDTPTTNVDELRSPSDGSSPIRPVVRKSSLNFASLPAREPLTNKSLGGRMSRTGNLDHNRASYYGRTTGGKSLGNAAAMLADDDEMDVDDEPTITNKKAEPEEQVAVHNKTYTQRLQDQINMLGQSQSKVARPSKSIANLVASQQSAAPVPAVTPAVATATAPVPTPAPAQQPPQIEERKVASPSRKPVASMDPGAFPEDDDDEWIDPPTAPQHASNIFSPRAGIAKSYSTDVMEGITKSTAGGTEFVLPKQRQQESRPVSPQRPPMVPDRTTSTISHMKSASVSALPDTGYHQMDQQSLSPKKGISVSNPTLATVSEDAQCDTPSKSPSRSFRDSPLKQVKNKLSSILKSSKGLLASSAAISAEGKSSIISSPSTTRLGFHAAPSTESMVQSATFGEALYPDLTRHATDAQTISSTASPPRTGRKTRASAERERKEKEKQKEKDKEARLMAGQMDKLEKAREKEREKARVFSKEQERIANMEKQIAAQKEQDMRAAAQKEAPKPTRTSPRKGKAQDQADGDVDMQDAQLMPPPSAPRSAGPARALRNPEAKRPTRPAAGKSKAAPTVIKVNMGSQHSQYHPSNSLISANLGEALGQGNSSQPQLNSKTSHASLKTKTSTQSLKGSVSSSGRPKALELAAKRKEQEEREAQRKRDVKAEMERKRAALQEEDRRQEQQRRLEAEKQREKERELAEAKKAAQRQAAIERAKQTRAPPPAVRTQPNGPPDYNAASEKQAQPARPPSRMNSAIHRSQEDLGRPVNVVLSNTSKAAQKRALPDDAANARNQQARNGTAYQAKDAKRRRTSQELGDEDEMETLPNIKGPPIRPSAGFKKDMPAKPYGYNNPPQTATRDLFKATVTAQHNSAVKASHPLDMAQVSKGAIPFAPNPNPPASHKTPARPGLAPGAKSAAKSAPRTSPRFQNGDSIELPEIQTDDEDEDEDDGPGMVATWANSPDLRRALVRQETMDPSHIFGAPAPLVLEEVFNKNKDRWHKFRARTSSANWSGTDRLTEEDIRKDLAARDRLRRDGGWTYELTKDMS